MGIMLDNGAILLGADGGVAIDFDCCCETGVCPEVCPEGLPRRLRITIQPLGGCGADASFIFEDTDASGTWLPTGTGCQVVGQSPGYLAYPSESGPYRAGEQSSVFCRGDGRFGFGVIMWGSNACASTPNACGGPVSGSQLPTSCDPFYFEGDVGGGALTCQGCGDLGQAFHVIITEE